MMPARKIVPGGALRRFGLDRPVHEVDDRPAQAALGRLLQDVGPCAGVRFDVVLPDHRRHDRPVAVTSAWPATSARASPRARSATSTTRTRSDSQFPVVKVLNAGRLLHRADAGERGGVAAEGEDQHQRADPACTSPRTSSAVYTDTDPRSYQLSSYSYLILPTKVQGQFNEAKGKTLARVRLLRDVPGPAAVRVARLLADADQPGEGELRPDQEDPRRRGAEHQRRRRATTRRSRPTARTLLAESAPQPQACDKAGQPVAVPRRHRRSEERADRGEGHRFHRWRRPRRPLRPRGGNGGGTQTAGGPQAGTATPGGAPSDSTVPGDSTPVVTDPSGSLPTDTSNGGVRPRWTPSVRATATRRSDVSRQAAARGGRSAAHHVSLAHQSGDVVRARSSSSCCSWSASWWSRRWRGGTSRRSEPRREAPDRPERLGARAALDHRRRESAGDRCRRAAAASPGQQGTDTSLAPTASQVTVSGRGAFAAMQFTVNQTKALDQPGHLDHLDGRRTDHAPEHPLRGELPADLPVLG